MAGMKSDEEGGGLCFRSTPQWLIGGGSSLPLVVKGFRVKGREALIGFACQVA